MTTAYMKRHLVTYALRLLLIAATVMTTLPANAQNNPYNIKDELYNMYVEAYAARTTAKGLQLSARMYNRAVLLDDRKAQCLAYTLPMSYYYHNRENKLQFFYAVKQLQDIAVKLGYMHYYYFAFTNCVNYYLSDHLTAKASSYINATEDFARQHNDNFGMYMCVCAHGQLNLACRDAYTAIEYFKQALKMAQELVPDADKPNLYRNIATCYAEMYDYTRMYDYAMLAYLNSETSITKMRTLHTVCYSTFMLGKYDEFERYFEIYSRLKGNVNPSSKDSEEAELAILKLLYDGDFNTALKHIMTKRKFIIRSRLLAEYHKLKGDNKSQSETLTSLYHKHIRDCDSVRSLNYDATYARFFNQQLNMKNQRLSSQKQQLENERRASEISNASLKLANTQLTLRNSSLELSRTRSESDLLRLSYRKKILESDKLRAQIAASKVSQSFTDMLSILGAIIVGIIITGAGLWLWTRSKMTADLKDTNNILEHNNLKLTQAKEHAEHANNVKTAFIQNMDNDIRTPLNSIISMARSIADSTNDTPAETLSELNRQLGNSTKQLLNIVDNVIRKT